jgi:hypothetical protein
MFNKISSLHIGYVPILVDIELIYIHSTGQAPSLLIFKEMSRFRNQTILLRDAVLNCKTFCETCLYSISRPNGSAYRTVSSNIPLLKAI